MRSTNKTSCYCTVHVSDICTWSFITLITLIYFLTNGDLVLSMQVRVFQHLNFPTLALSATFELILLLYPE